MGITDNSGLVINENLHSSVAGDAIQTIITKLKGPDGLYNFSDLFWVMVFLNLNAFSTVYQVMTPQEAHTFLNKLFESVMQQSHSVAADLERQKRGSTSIFNFKEINPK